jgi:Fur family peroxide stress response transcriptional regulator
MIKSDPKISLGTVYRNLALLSENGIIKRIDTEDNSVHYDGDISRHYHFVCDKCARVFDIEYAEQTDIDREIEKKYGYTVSSHTLIFYGLCNDCKKD